MAARPNVLLVTIDQWRGDCLSSAGHPVVRTPNLDRLAAAGTRFASHHAQAAPCGPSRASLFTGLYARNHRSVANGTPLDDRFTNLARELRRGGYDPVCFGYTDTTVDPRTVAADDARLRSYEGLLPGFRWGAELLEDRRPWLASLVAAGHDPDGPLRDYLAACQQWTGDRTLEQLAAPAPFAAEESETAWLTDRVLAHLAEAAEPWCTHVAYIRPHPPFVAPAPYHRLVDPADVPLPARHRTVDEEAAVHPFLAARLRTTAFRAHPDERTTRQLRATYYGMIAEVDVQFGRLLDAVDADGRGERTVVVVTSDHGEMLGDHWLLGKVGFHRASYHVPLLVRAPAPAVAGTVVDVPTEHVDVLPTLLELVGLPPTDQGDGRSLGPLLTGTGDGGWRTDTHWEFAFREWARSTGWDVRTCGLTTQRDDRSTYVHFGGMAPLFFDRADDPDELVDRAGDLACAGPVLEQAQRMLAWEHATRDESLARLLVTPEGLVRLDG